MNEGNIDYSLLRLFLPFERRAISLRDVPMKPKSIEKCIENETCLVQLQIACIRNGLRLDGRNDGKKS